MARNGPHTGFDGNGRCYAQDRTVMLKQIADGSWGLHGSRPAALTRTGRGWQRKPTLHER